MVKEVSDNIHVSFVKMLKKVSFSFSSSNIKILLNHQITLLDSISIFNPSKRCKSSLPELTNIGIAHLFQSVHTLH